jgi:hypothetical protein
MRLLEFKRQENDSYKEAAKLEYLRRGLSALEAKHLIPVSKEAHWFLQSSKPVGNFDLRIVPYLFQDDTKYQSITLEQFIASTVHDAIHGTDEKASLFMDYLTLVASCQGSVRGSSGGLVVTVDKTGTVHYAIVEDLRELGMKLVMLHDFYLERQIQLQKQYERQYSRSYGDRERGGPTYGR